MRDESIVVAAVRCKRLVDRDASLTATALSRCLYGGAVLAGVAHHDESSSVVAARCQLGIDRISRHSVGRIDRIVVGGRRLAM